MDPPEDPRRSPRVGLIYDERMCGHNIPYEERHPECPDRIRAIWRKLESEGVTKRCAVFAAKEAEDKDVALVHTRKHIDLVKEVGRGSTVSDARKRLRVAARFNSIYLNDRSSESAFLAAGSVLEATEKVAKGDLTSAIAIVRPPGHHAEPDEAMGFCLFNNVAIASSFLLNERPDLGIKKILIVDWDVHHGNGTQKMFWNDPRVLFFSVHRFDFGSFYPGGDDGSHTMIGEGLGTGYNINVPWEHGQCGDADYLAVWDHILLPVAEAYNPDIILISGGFDAAIGDPLGGCHVTPHGYFTMMRKLMVHAEGKIMMALEGGYNLDSLAKSIVACAEALLGEKVNASSPNDLPFESTIRVIQAVRQELSPYWPAFAMELPQNVSTSTRKAPPTELLVHTISDSDEDTQGTSAPVKSTDLVTEANTIEVVEDVIAPLSKLSVDENGHGKEVVPDLSSSLRSHSLSSSELSLPDQIVGDLVHWRASMSKINIWYGSYGSNMWMPRFLCYIRGGQVEGLNKSCLGSKDKNLPMDVTWKTVPHCLFFARSHTEFWGTGGVAFLHPEQNINDKAYMCFYKITLEQFNDVLLQENIESCESAYPLLDYSSLNNVIEKTSISLDTLKGGWYSNVLYMGRLDDIPALTMTCPLSQIRDFESGRLPMLPPSSGYTNTLVKGLVEGNQLSESEALDYLKSASLRR